MTERVFIDTNILVYADDADAGDKRQRAREVVSHAIRNTAAVLSTQVLEEYFAIATRKLGLSAEQARARVEALSELSVVVIRPDLILAAIDLTRLRAISFWDALIVRSAQRAGCKRLLTEDLGHGGSFEDVIVENPFRWIPADQNSHCSCFRQPAMSTDSSPGIGSAPQGLLMRMDARQSAPITLGRRSTWP